MLPGEPAHWRTACTPLDQPAHRTALARLPFSQAAIHTALPMAIKTKTRGVTWMVNRTHTVWIIQTFEILKWQLFFQNAFVGCYSSAPSLKMDMKNTTTCRVPFHESMPSFKNFRWAFDLLEFKNKVSQRFVGNQRCPGVWNSFPVLAWDLSMHPRTHIWFSNQFICIGACACSSNLNYAHKCIETQLMHKNVQTNPEKSQKLTQHSCCSMLTREKIESNKSQ